MKSFPSYFVPSNSEKFPQYRHKRLLCYLRKELYEHIICSPGEPYTTQQFKSRYKNLVYPDAKENSLKEDEFLELITKVSEELKQQGWAVELVYNNNMIYIFDPNNRPERLDWYQT